MLIDFIFDTMCPWCYVGKRRLGRALALRPGLNHRIRWRPFRLYPELPPNGMDQEIFLNEHYGDAQRARRQNVLAVNAGQTEGIDFAFERITRAPNTLLSHRLIRYAAEYDCEEAIVEGIFRSYLCEGVDIGDIAALTSIAAAAGIPADDVAAHLRSKAGTTAINSENTHNHRLGVSGVPTLIVDERFGLSGAYEPDVLLRLIDLALATEGEMALSHC